MNLVLPRVTVLATLFRYVASSFGLLAGLAILAACTTSKPSRQEAADRTIAKPTCPHVPAPLQAKPPLPPVSAFPQVLQPGHWQWDDGNYVWTPPKWQARFAAKPPAWQDGHWSADGGACVWHNGHFRAAALPG